MTFHALGNKAFAHPEFEVFSQGAGRIVKKSAKKYLKKYIDDVVGHWVEMTAQELKEFWTAFEAHVREQWQDLVDFDDRDPVL